jgi:putative transposase
MYEGLLAASVAVGLDVMAELMEAEVTDLAGPKGKHNPARTAKRHASEHGTVTLGGRRVSVRRRRVRTVGDDEHELPVASYETFVSADLLADGVVARMLGGLSTRGYRVGLESVGSSVEQHSSATSHSAVSRRSVTATAERLTRLLQRPLGGQRWLVVFLDGFSMGEHLLVGALGVTADGTTLGPKAVIQRCRRHKERNVTDYLPEDERPLVPRPASARAWPTPSRSTGSAWPASSSGPSSRPTPSRA